MEEVRQEVLEIIQSLNTQNKIMYIEGAFRKYIDNQVSDSELDYILKKNGEVLPDEFFDMPVREKKKYYTHTATIVDVLDHNIGYRTDQIFNKNYFYRLADASKGNKELTGILVQYVAEIGYDWNLLFICMQHIKLANIKPTFLTKRIEDYRKENGNIHTIYDLIISVFSEWEFKKGNKELRQDIAKTFANPKFLNVNFSHPFFNFILLMECLLGELPKKDANALKIKFLILQKEHLRDNDYYQTEDRGKRAVNTAKSKLKDSKMLKTINKFIKDNKEWYDNAGPNGYFALYASVMAE